MYIISSQIHRHLTIYKPYFFVRWKPFSKCLKKSLNNNGLIFGKYFTYKKYCGSQSTVRC